MKSQEERKKRFRKMLSDPDLTEEALKHVKEDMEKSKDKLSAFSTELTALIEKHILEIQPAYIAKLLCQYAVYLAKNTAPYVDREIKELFSYIVEMEIEDINKASGEE